MFSMVFCRKRRRSLTLGFFLSLAVAMAALGPRPVQAEAQAQPVDASPEASSVLQQGWQEFQAGRYQQALRHYQLAHSLHEPSGDAQLVDGRVDAQRGPGAVNSPARLGAPAERGEALADPGDDPIELVGGQLEGGAGAVGEGVDAGDASGSVAQGSSKGA